MTKTAGRTWKDYKSNTETAQELNTVGYDTTNDATTHEFYNERCYNEQFSSIKSGCYNEKRCYRERG